MFEGKLKKAYKTCVKHTILNLGHALLTHHEAPRIHKPHECHPEGSWEHLGASCGPSGSHLEVLWELPGASWEHSGHSTTCLGRAIQQNSQPFTSQPQVFILQPGLAECAKPLKCNVCTYVRAYIYIYIHTHAFV